jgi:hypothetical protein
MQMMHNNNGVSVLCFSTYLLQYRSDPLQRQRGKLILLQEIVQILLEHFKHQTCVVLVLEALESSHEVELVSIFLAQSREDGDFNLSLAGVGWMILQNLDGDDVAGAFFPAFHHLSECSASEELENLRKRSKTKF